MATTDVLHAYRHLYRNLLQAVQYSSPARYIARDQLRKAFRDKNASLDAEGVKRTIWFLEAAKKETGLEHRILKNLIKVRRMRRRDEGGTWKKILRESGQRDEMKKEKESAFLHYDMTVAMLNESMGLCLR
ncbi:hypothetical protein QQS21_005877 [Conoideocrella luteorostrata]|uniref:Complex 1 LYR protein n=1 Tax=Conoideocrella luteorostrata TaxID=1105319 RepID=A0AAJ0CRJ2_9HYPO|nr:hypothetical protein QQS21_005877 [Conoideocrella luteorostrata]